MISQSSSSPVPEALSTQKKNKDVPAMRGSYHLYGSKGAYFKEYEAEFLSGQVSCASKDYSETVLHLDQDDEYMDLYLIKNYRRMKPLRSKGSKGKWPVGEITAKKENTEKKLASKNIKRKGLPNVFSERSSPLEVARKKRKPGKERWKSRDQQDLEQALKESQLDCSAVRENALDDSHLSKGSANILSNFVSLQHRDLSPEDYDLLLQLDELVEKKTISLEKLQSFKTFLATATNIGEMCTICMDQYEEEQKLKVLPCEHYFHLACIDNWLSKMSPQCPLDGLPV